MKQFHGWRIQLPQERSKLRFSFKFLHNVWFTSLKVICCLCCAVPIISCGKFALTMSSLYMAVSTKFAASLRSSCRLCLWLWARGFLEICGKLALIMSCFFVAVSTWFPRNLRQARAHHVVFVYGSEHVVSSKFAASSRSSCRLCIWLWEHVVSSKLAASSRSSCRLCLWLWEHVVSSKFSASSRSSCRLCLWLCEHVVSSKFAANLHSSCRLCLRLWARGFLSRLIICYLSAPEDGQPNCLVCWQIGWEMNTEGGGGLALVQ